MNPRAKRILHVITSLRTGGAEAMLTRLLKYRESDQSVMVISMLSGGSFLNQIKDMGITVLELPFNRPSLCLSRLWGTIPVLQQFNPDLVVGWMHHGNLFAWVIQKILFKQSTLIWNLRGTLYSLWHEKITSWPVIYLNAWLSRGVGRILFNGALSRQHYAAIGLDVQRSGVVYNGFDLSRCFPDAAESRRLRNEWGVGDAPVVGMVARYHPMKDHKTFLQAAKILSATHPQVRYVLAGMQMTSQNVDLMAWIQKMKLQKHIILLGERTDGDTLARGFTIATLSSSRGENLPNVLGEAMACGVPCVATRVGDVPVILGEVGIGVPPSDPQALAAGWAQILDLREEEYMKLARRSQQWIRDNFSIHKAVRNYEAEYERCLNASHCGYA